MDLVAALAVLGLVATNVFWLIGYQQREKEITAERRELLTRITHPEMIPVEESQLPPDTELLTADVDDEYDLVGVVEGGVDNG